MKGLFLVAFSSLLIFARAAAVQEEALPLIPITTAFIHGDHHWIMWIPENPMYEAVEVERVEASGPTGG